MLRKTFSNLCVCAYQRTCQTNRQVPLNYVGTTSLATNVSNHRSFSTSSVDFVAKRSEVLDAAEEEHRLRNELKCEHLYRSIQRHLKCSANDVVNMIVDYPAIRNQSGDTIEKIIKYLMIKGVSRQTILENPLLLGYTFDEVKQRLQTIDEIKPKGKEFNDFIPLLRASEIQLYTMKKKAFKERLTVGGEHRLYYISDRLNVSPYIVAQYLSNRLFMFNIPLQNLMQILDTMLHFKIEPLYILRDLWSFRYSPKVVEARLKRAQLGEKDRLMPWMVRCTEKVLARSIKNAQDEKALLGQETIVEYLANRLGYDIDTTRYILQKHVSIYKVRVTKIKDILDYLLEEAGFTPHHIAQNPRIMCHSLQTTKQRLAELKAHGCTPTSLVVVCRSITEYNKFLETWIDVRKKLGKIADAD